MAERPKKKPQYGRGKTTPTVPSKRERRVQRTSEAQVAALDRSRPLWIELQARHKINGVVYGPGRIRVAGHIARSLMESDQRAVRAEDELFQPTARILVKSGTDGRLTSKKVAPDAFDDLGSITRDARYMSSL